MVAFENLNAWRACKHKLGVGRGCAILKQIPPQAWQASCTFERSVMLMSSCLDVCVGCKSWETASCGQSVHLSLGLVRAEAITAWVSYQMCPHSKPVNVNVSQQRLKGWPWPVVHGGGQAWCKHRPMHILPVSTCHGILTCINVQCLDPMHQMGLCKPTAYTKR